MHFIRFISNLFKSGTLKQKDVKTVKSHNTQPKKSYTHLTFNPAGVYFDNNLVFIPWTAIERIVAFKADLLTTDCILLEVTYGCQKIIFSEEADGWLEFIDAITIFLPATKKDWHEKVMLPAFKTNSMTIYEREDRAMPERNNFYSELFLQSTEAVIIKFQNEDWSVNKCSFTDFEMTNNWSELVLAKTDNNLLLHGAVAYHQDNINMIKNILDSFNCGYNIEFYQDDILTVQFKK